MPSVAWNKTGHTPAHQVSDDDVAPSRDGEPCIRVLLVHDDLKYHHALSEAFARFGGHVDGLPGMEGLLAWLAERSPTALVVGDHLTDADPLELVRQIRSSERWRHLPIHLVTTTADTELKLRAFMAGADAVLEQKSSVAEIVARVLGRANRETPRSAKQSAAQRNGGSSGTSSAESVPDVMIIEDDVSLVQMFEYAIRNRGYSVASYGNGLEALDVLRTLDVGDQEPVVLLDIDLPGMDGFEILQKVEEERPGIFRFLVTTIHSSEAAQVLALQTGAQDYLVKPLRMPVVVAKIERQLRARRTG